MLAVIDGPTLKKYNVHNMPTLMSDTQMVLPIDTVKYQYQEVFRWFRENAFSDVAIFEGPIRMSGVKTGAFAHGG